MQVTKARQNCSPNLQRNLPDESFRQAKHKQSFCSENKVDGVRRLPKKEGISRSNLGESVDKTPNFENIETCSNSKMSHREEELQNPVLNAQNSHLCQCKPSVEIVQQCQIPVPEGQIDSVLANSVGRRVPLMKLSHNSNSLEIELPYDQKQQNQQRTHEQQDDNLRVTQKRIIHSNSGINKKHCNPSLNSIIDSIETVKNLNIFSSGDEEQTKQHLREGEKGHFEALDKSSCSSQHHNQINEIWNQRQYELHDLEGLNQKYGQSSCESEDDAMVHLIKTSKYNSLKQEYDDLLNKNERLMFENKQLVEQLSSLKLHKKLSDQESIRDQILQEQNKEGWVQLSEENQQLNSLILQYKKAQYQNGLLLKEYNTKISCLQRELQLSHLRIDKKEDELQALISIIQEKTQDYQDALLVNNDLEEILEAKTVQYEAKTVALHNEINQLKETVDFYKGRLEEEGFTFNLEQIKRIKQIFDYQVDHEETIVNNLSKEYSMTLANLEQENKLYASQISVLKDKSRESQTEHYQKHLSILTAQTQDIIEEYDRQLQLRDDEIMQLKKKMHEDEQTFREINLLHCKPYLRHVDKMTALILNQNIHRYSSPELIIEFVYIVNKLCKMFMMAEKKIVWAGRQKDKITNLMNAKQKLFAEEINEIQFKVRQLEYERKKLKQSHDKLQKMETQGHLKKETVQKTCQPQTPEKKKVLNQCKKKTVQSIQKIEKSEAEKTCLTLDQLIKRHDLNETQQIQLFLTLIQLSKDLLTQSKKPISIMPDQINVILNGDYFQLSHAKSLQGKSKETQKSLMYSAPEVLLGFSESQNSYVWTIGLIIDSLLHGSLFYKKINEITSRSENYHCRDQKLPLRAILESMLKKKQKERTSLDEVKTALGFFL